MQDERSSSSLFERTRCLEAAALALLLAEDWPWHPWELAARLRCPTALLSICVARLRADGLVRDEATRGGTARAGAIRASWAAVRCDELLRRCAPGSAPDRTNVERCLPNKSAARLLACRHLSGDNSAPNHE